MQVEPTQAASTIAIVDPNIAAGLARAAELKKYEGQRDAAKKVYGKDPKEALNGVRNDLKRFHEDKLPAGLTLEQRAVFLEAFRIAFALHKPLKDAAQRAVQVQTAAAQRPPNVATKVAQAANDGIAAVRTFVQQKIDDGTVDQIVKTGEHAIDAISHGFAAGRDWLRNVSRKN